MVRKALIGMVALAVAGLSGGGATATPGPVQTQVRCYTHDFQPSCGYWASGPGRLVALRTAPWVARIKRDGQLVWSVGGAFGASINIPSQAGDQVQIALIAPSHCDLPTGGQVPVCGGAGPVFAYEGGPSIPFLP